MPFFLKNAFSAASSQNFVGKRPNEKTCIINYWKKNGVSIYLIYNLYPIRWNSDDKFNETWTLTTLTPRCCRVYKKLCEPGMGILKTVFYEP